MISIIGNLLAYHYGRCAGEKLGSTVILANAEISRADVGTSVAVIVAVVGCQLGFSSLDHIVAIAIGAMVDAAIGGKTAINYGGYKNMAGTFYPAQQIFVAVSLLKSLPEGEFRSGLGEVIKTALLGDAALLESLSSQKERILSRDPDLMEETIRRCIAVKAALVEEDLREHGKRAFLNLGHTFAHAVEALTGY